MAHTDTRVWICPKQCGCELAITATWVQPPAIINGRVVSYQHPIPDTILAIAIGQICAEHEPLRTEPLPADPYDGAPGYLAVPDAPTEAERLYVHLYRYVSQRMRPDTCGCAIHVCVDRRTGQTDACHHPRLTRRCARHQADDAQHSEALADNALKNRIVERLIAAGIETPQWAFEGRRVVISGIPTASRAVLQQAFDADEGIDRVQVR